MTFIPHTEEDRHAMLAAIGVERLEDLFADVPEAVRFPTLNLPPPAGEMLIDTEMRALADQNAQPGRLSCFLGAGAYQHYRPSTVDYVINRGEFYTAYTPYQPEIAQGMLQAAFEYQSLICRLTGMEISNASHYDGASSLAEAVLFALHLGRGQRHRIIVSPSVHPQYRAVLQTYLQGADAEVIGDTDFRTEAGGLTRMLSEETAALVVQSPNFFGQFEALEGIADQVHANGALFIVVPEPISLGLFRSPGEDGADVVAAEGQVLGMPVSFGGPHLGIFATRREHARKMVGRLVAETVDAEGGRGYVLTLATREQHIRRAKATSNICTNAALSALAAAVYLSTLGKSGLQQVARLCYDKSHYAAQQIRERVGFEVNAQAPERPFFKEFTIRLPVSVATANRVLLEQFDTIGGYDLSRDYPELENHMLVAVTEMNTREQIDRLVAGLRELGR